MASRRLENSSYWSIASIAVAQVFLGVGAGTFFTGELDINKVFVVIFNITLSLVFFIVGGRIQKR